MQRKIEGWLEVYFDKMLTKAVSGGENLFFAKKIFLKATKLMFFDGKWKTNRM